MDPDYPATKRFIAVAQEILGRALPTLTPARLDAMDRQIAENRRLRQMMYGGRVRPVELGQETDGSRRR